MILGSFHFCNHAAWQASVSFLYNCSHLKLSPQPDTRRHTGERFSAWMSSRRKLSCIRTLLCQLLNFIFPSRSPTISRGSPIWYLATSSERAHHEEAFKLSANHVRMSLISPYIVLFILRAATESPKECTFHMNHISPGSEGQGLYILLWEYLAQFL